MSQTQFDDPETEGAARAAQMVAMSATMIEALARLQAQRSAQRADDEERTSAAARAQRTADHAAARVSWSPARDDDWLRRASTADLGAAWSAAATWAGTDPDAANTLNRVEARLHQLHPEAMAVYHEARARGADPKRAMGEAAQHFGRPMALTSGGDGRVHRPADQEPRPPHVVAGDAYPYPVQDGVTAAARGQVHVITDAPGDIRQSNRATARR